MPDTQMSALPFDTGPPHMSDGAASYVEERMESGEPPGRFKSR